MKDKREVCISQHEDYRWSENRVPSIRNLGEGRRALIGFAPSDLFFREWKVEGWEAGWTSETLKTEPNPI